MHVAAATHGPHTHDDVLHQAVDLAAELITDWRDPNLDRHLDGHGPQPLIYRVARAPFTHAAGVSAARRATQLIYATADHVVTEHALVDTAFRVGMGSGVFVDRLARGETVSFPPPRETLTQWLMRLERDLANWLLTRLVCDPPPGDDLMARAMVRHYRAKAGRFLRSATQRANQEMVRDRAR